MVKALLLFIDLKSDFFCFLYIPFHEKNKWKSFCFCSCFMLGFFLFYVCFCFLFFVFVFCLFFFLFLFCVFVVSLVVAFLFLLFFLFYFCCSFVSFLLLFFVVFVAFCCFCCVVCFLQLGQTCHKVKVVTVYNFLGSTWEQKYFYKSITICYSLYTRVISKIKTYSTNKKFGNTLHFLKMPLNLDIF